MEPKTATVTANGESVVIKLPCSVADFLSSSGWRATQVVVEVNARIVPRARFAEVSMQEGDRIEVIVPVAGG